MSIYQIVGGNHPPEINPMIGICQKNVSNHFSQKIRILMTNMLQCIKIVDCASLWIWFVLKVLSIDSKIINYAIGQVAKIILGSMPGSVCFDILDPYLIRVIDKRVVMLNDFITGPTHIFYLLQYKILSLFCLDSYVVEKWEEEEYQDYLYCLEIFSTLVELRLLGFHPLNLTGEKTFSFIVAPLVWWSMSILLALLVGWCWWNNPKGMCESKILL